MNAIPAHFIHGTILYTIPAQNCPKGKGQWLFLFPDGQHRTGESSCEMFEITWQVLTLNAVLH